MKKRPYVQFIQEYMSEKAFRRNVLWAFALMMLIWVSFFDSHSIYKRLTWHAESQKLAAENLQLQERIDDLDEQLEVGISDEMIEQLARERYGMRKEGETVYRIQVVD